MRYNLGFVLAMCIVYLNSTSFLMKMIPRNSVLAEKELLAHIKRGPKNHGDRCMI